MLGGMRERPWKHFYQGFSDPLDILGCKDWLEAGRKQTSGLLLQE